MLDFNIENLLNSTIGYVGFLSEVIEPEIQNKGFYPLHHGIYSLCKYSPPHKVEYFKRNIVSMSSLPRKRSVAFIGPSTLPWARYS